MVLLFTGMCVSDGKSHLFAKSKVAPQKTKNLPTLKFMGVCLVLKYLPLILNFQVNQVQGDGMWCTLSNVAVVAL